MDVKYFFEVYPTVDTLFVTTDGMVFLTQAQADAHAVYIGGMVAVVNRNDIGNEHDSNI